MTRVMVRAAAVLALAVLAASCGGGGGGGGPVSPPPAPAPPPSPPPPPPPPPPPVTTGLNAAGGRTTAAGDFTGSFRGPSLTLQHLPQLVSPIDTLSGSTATTGALVTYSGGVITISAGGEGGDFSGPGTETEYFGGAVTEVQRSFANPGGSTESLAELQISSSHGWDPTYARTLYYSAKDPTGDFTFEAMIAVGANQTVVPTTGVVEFEVTVYGYYINYYQGTQDRFYGEGVFTIDLSTRQVYGEIADLDFTSAAPGADPTIISETASDGVDFGMEFRGGFTTGTEFGAQISVEGASVVGTFRGGFFGPQNGSAEEIAGVLHLFGPDIYGSGALHGEYRPMEPGANRSGGVVSSTGFVGDFRGPTAGIVRQGGDYFLVVGEQREAGDQYDVVATIGPKSSLDDEPRLTIRVGPDVLDFDLDDAQTIVMQDGGGTVSDFLTEQRVEAVVGGETQIASVYTFNLDNDPRIPTHTRTRYGHLLSFASAETADDSLNLFLFMPIGADRVVMPSSGSASFNSGVYGIYFGDLGAASFNGRGDIAVNFATGAVDGEFEDVDFDFGPGLNEFGPGGVDFGLLIDATVAGDDFTGDITATRADMDGFIIGDFYGPTGAAPEEIGAAFSILGPDGAAFGGMQGILD